MKQILLLLSALLVSSGITLADQTNIPRIHNPSTPSLGKEQLKLTELWRTGGEDEDVIFGEIVDVVTDAAGNYYILDNQLCQVMVFSPIGEFQRTLSREGEGPGEIQQPIDLLLLPDESRGIAMGFPGKIVRIKYNDAPMGTLYPVGDPADGGFGVLRGARYNDGILAACGGYIEFSGEGGGSNNRNISLTDLSCSERTSILEKSTPMLFAERKYIEADEYYVTGRWDLSPDGRIYAAANRDRYEISFYDKAGQLSGIIERDYEPRRRTQAEKDLVGSDMQVEINGEQIEFDRFVEDYDECISRLFIADDGTLWVQTAHGTNDLPKDILEIWDLFDKDGKYIKQISVPLGAEINSGTTYFPGRNKLVVITSPGDESAEDETESESSDETEPLEIICYQID